MEAIGQLESLYTKSENNYRLAGKISKNEWIKQSSSWNQELNDIIKKYSLNSDYIENNKFHYNAAWRYLALTSIDLFSLHDNYSSEILSGESPNKDKREYLIQCVVDDFKEVRKHLE